MAIIIQLSERVEAALKAHAQAHGVSEEGYVRNIVERDLAIAADASLAPFKTDCGSFAKYGLAPTSEEIAVNRGEMFQDFGERS